MKAITIGIGKPAPLLVYRNKNNGVSMMGMIREGNYSNTIVITLDKRSYESDDVKEAYGTVVSLFKADLDVEDKFTLSIRASVLDDNGKIVLPAFENIMREIFSILKKDKVDYDSVLLTKGTSKVLHDELDIMSAVLSANVRTDVGNLALIIDAGEDERRGFIEYGLNMDIKDMDDSKKDKKKDKKKKKGKKK